jgi:hypothetical protein
MKTFIILQGSADYLFQAERHYRNIKTEKIWSVWGEELRKYFHKPSDAQLHLGKYVVFNNYPKVKGIGNIFFQQKNTMSGLLKAKKLGATHALKLRSDMIFSDLDKLIKILMENPDAIYFPGWHDFEGGYFMDFFQFGKIDDLIKLWDFKPKITDYFYEKFKIFRKLANKYFDYRINNFPERLLTKSFFKNFKDVKPKYIIPLLKENDITCWWPKYDKFLESIMEEPLYRFDKFK